MASAPDLIVLHEHPEWQKPLFAALGRRGLSFLPFDVTRAAFSNVEPPLAPLYFNQASPSAYIRGNTRAVPLALAFMRSLELRGARVLNGANVFALELSQERPGYSAKHARHRLSVLHHLQRRRRAAQSRPRCPMAGALETGPGRQRRTNPGSRVDVTDRRDLRPRPDRSGCRTICSCSRNFFHTTPTRASSVSSSSAESCSTPCASRRTGSSTSVRRRCAIRTMAMVRARCHESVAAPPVEFYPYPEVPRDAVDTAKRIVRAAKLDVGGIEYLET